MIRASLSVSVLTILLYTLLVHSATSIQGPRTPQVGVDDDGIAVGPGGWSLPSEPELADVRCDIERKESLNELEFLRDYFLKKPVVITNMTRDWPALRRWSKEFLLSKFKRSKVAIGTSESIVYAGGFGENHVRFRNFMYDAARRPRQSSKESLYLFDEEFFNHTPELRTDWTTPDMWLNRTYNRTYFLVGKDMSGVGTHRHADGWNALFFGLKRWFLYSPETVLPEDHEPPSQGQIHWYRHVYPTLNETLRPIECVQRPGDILYIPFAWYHATINIGETVGIAEQMTDHITQSTRQWYMRFVGEKLRLAGRWKEALDYFVELTRYQPDDYQLHHKIGVVMSHLRPGPELAIKHFLKSIDLKPDCVVCYADFASMLLEVEEYGGAAWYMGQAVRIEPNNAQNWLSLAFAQAHYGHGNSSRHLYNGVGKFMPSSLSPNPSPDMFDFSESVAPVARLYVAMGTWKSPSRKARMMCTQLQTFVKVARMDWARYSLLQAKALNPNLPGLADLQLYINTLSLKTDGDRPLYEGNDGGHDDDDE